MFGFGDDNEIKEGVPYYGVQLTLEQAEKIKGKRLEFYSVDGKTIFDVRDKDGKVTGQAFFVVFV